MTTNDCTIDHVEVAEITIKRTYRDPGLPSGCTCLNKRDASKGQACIRCNILSPYVGSMHGALAYRCPKCRLRFYG